MTTASKSRPSVSRRTALAGLGAGGLGVALAVAAQHTTAQDASAMAAHPLVGTWMGGTGPNDLALVHWDADGAMTLQSSPVGIGADGAPVYNDPVMGIWEPDGARGIHITFTWVTRDATGASLGSTTVDGYPVASEDGMSYVDDGARVVVTLRDQNGAVTQTIDGVPPVIGVRATPGKPGYDEALAMIAARAAATPTP